MCKSLDKTIKLWKVSERDKRPEGYNLKDEEGRLKDMTTITSLQVRAPARVTIWLKVHCVSGCFVIIYCRSFWYPSVFPLHFPSIPASKVPVLKPTDLMVEVRPRRVFSNGHTYHVNSISVNSDGETYLSADDLRINMWHLDITDRSFNILLVVLVWDARGWPFPLNSLHSIQCDASFWDSHEWH